MLVKDLIAFLNQFNPNDKVFVNVQPDATRYAPLIDIDKLSTTFDNNCNITVSLSPYDRYVKSGAYPNEKYKEYYFIQRYLSMHQGECFYTLEELLLAIGRLGLELSEITFQLKGSLIATTISLETTADRFNKILDIYNDDIKNLKVVKIIAPELGKPFKLIVSR